MKEKKKIIGLFNKLEGSRNLWEVFSDVITMFACEIQAPFLPKDKQKKIDEMNDNTRKHYSLDECKIIVEIFKEITDALEENPFQDYLGSLYMWLNLGNKGGGQFFTPYNISLMTAQIAISAPEAKVKIDEQGYITIMEPSLGGGSTVIAALEILDRYDINYQTQCVVVGQEVSQITALIAYVMLSLIGCAAVIKVGDTLQDPYTCYIDELNKGSNLWTTPMFNWQLCGMKV